MRRASLRSTLDLQKKRTIFKDISVDEKDVPCALEYDKGHLNDYRLGSAHVKGHFLLSLPHGQYQRPSLQDMERGDDFMTQWALETGIAHEDTPFFRDFVINPSALALYVAPNFQLGSPQAEIFMKFVACYLSMDDYIDNAISSASITLSTQNLQELRESVTAILNGKVGATQEAWRLEVPFFNSVCLALVQVARGMVNIVPDYSRQCSYFVRSVSDWLDSISLFANLMGKNWQSDLCYMTVRRENGQKALFEIICLLHQVFLDEEIRKSLPFKIFYDAGDYVTSLANDVFSLEQELASGEFSCNMILRKSVLKKLPLQVAVDQCRDMANEACCDMDQAAKDLLQVHPDNKSLLGFIREYKCFVDGSLFLYTYHKHKFGPCKFSIRKVTFEDCLF